jgi:uncharacterized protein (TIGR03118 family)
MTTHRLAKPVGYSGGITMPKLQGTARTARGILHLGTLIGALAIAACNGGSASAPPPAMQGPPPSMPQPTSLTFNIDPTTLYVGESATASWNSSASPCTASGAWSGSEGASGNQPITATIAGNFTYTLTCADANASVSVIVKAADAAVYTVSTIVSDTSAGGGGVIDPKLIDPWGIGAVVQGFEGTATPGVQLTDSGESAGYDTQGNALWPAVTLPSGFKPTGLVVNVDLEFDFNNKSCGVETAFIYAGEGGMLAGWSPLGCPGGPAAITYTAADNAVYKGLTIDPTIALYATDFHNGKIDTFDTLFTKQTPSATSWSFSDPMLPANYAPFGIYAVTGVSRGSELIYVAYAQRDSQLPDEPAVGAGMGLVDVFDAKGNFIKRLVAPGAALNAPWGMAMAPADFGVLSNALLIANFGDGKINGYDPNTGQFIATLADSSGAPLVVPGLHGIVFGYCPGTAYSPLDNTLFFTAAPGGGQHGILGSIVIPR